jgi:hypothetical protein
LAKATPKTADELISEALEKALLRGNEARLITVGKKPEGAGLFPDEKGARKTAVEKCLYAEPAMLKVVRSEEVKIGKRKQVQRFVAITRHGIEFLFSKLAPDRVGDLFSQCSGQAVAELHAQQTQFDKIVQARQQVLDNVQALTQQLVATARRAQESVHDATEKATLLQSCLDGLPLPASLLPSAPARPPLRRTATEEEARFRKQTSQQMVFAWQESALEGREPIERALFNLGAEPIGRPGERVEFAGRIHECHESVFPGDSVEIVRSGWLLRDESGGYLLGHAQVKVVQQTAE